MNAANQNPKPEVTLRFLAGSHAFLSDAEVLQVLRHRYVIGYYLLGICAAACLHGVVRSDGTAALVLPISAATVFVFVGVAVAYLRAWVRLSGQTEQVTVWMSPGLLLAASVAHLTSVALYDAMQFEDALPFSGWAGIVFNFVLAELAAAVALRSLVPRTQRSFRAKRNALEVLRHGPDATVLTFARTRILCADILRVEANGNHVCIVTEHKHHIVPGPFASVLEKLPKGTGCRVHRSHWVATAAVRRVERDKQGVRVVTVQGDEVPVSQRLAPDAMRWLETVSRQREATTRPTSMMMADTVPTLI